MAKTKDNGLISLLVIVALLLPVVAMPADVTENDGTYLNITGNVVKLWCEENRGSLTPEMDDVLGSGQLWALGGHWESS